MFPDRVGRVIMDGVEDPISHASIPSHFAWAHTVESVDAVFEGFAQDCALAGPSGCPISTDTSTGPGIVEWTRDLVEVCTIVHFRLRPHSHFRLGHPRLLQVEWGRGGHLSICVLCLRSPPSPLLSFRVVYFCFRRFL